MTSFGIHQTRADLDRADLAAAFGADFLPVRRLRDRTQVAGTVGIWDFVSAWGAPGGYAPVADVGAATEMRNMVAGGTAAVRDNIFGQIGYATGGVKITGGGSILLTRTEWRPGMMSILWFRSTGMTVGDNGRLLKLGPVFVVPDPANFQVYGPGQGFGGLHRDLRGAITDGNLHQLAVQSEARPGGTHRIVIRLDRVTLFEGPDIAAQPVANAEYAIGARDGAGTIDGRIYRVRIDDTTGGATADEIVAADYRANIARL